MLYISRHFVRGNALSLLRLGSRCLVNRQLREYSSAAKSEDPKCQEKKEESKCGKILAEYPCGPGPAEEYKPKPPTKKQKLKSMWEIEDCEDENRCILPLRYDMKYYRISDKDKREYQVTWNECPRMLIKPRKVCLYDMVKRPKMVKRKPKQHGGVAQKDESGTAVSCGPKKGREGTCVYIKAPCCRIGRRPPKCKSAFSSLGKCTKRKAPYPSFSECLKDPAIDLPPIECKCVDLPALCDAWAVLRRRIAKGKPAVKGCGEA